MADDNEKQLLQDIANSQKQIYSNLSLELDLVATFDPDVYSTWVIKIAARLAQLASLFSTDPVATAIRALFDKLYDVYVALNAANAATQLLAKMTFLNNAAQNANTALKDLKLVL